MWKLLAKTSAIMERIPKHSVGLFSILFFIIGVSNVYCGTVTGEDQKGLLGNNPVTLTCAFTVEAGGIANSMVIRRQRAGAPSFSDIATFNIPANFSFYSDTSLQVRSVLILLEDSASITFSSLECRDAATYQCFFEYVQNGAKNTADTMSLVIEAKPIAPTISPAFSLSDKVFVEYEELEVRCEGDVGLPAGNFVWFGYRNGNRQADFTSLASPGQPTEIGSGDRFCAFTRESILKLNVTRDDDDLVIRCVVNHTTLGSPPQSGDNCDSDRCKMTGPIEVLYPIRPEDLQISSNPAQSQYIVGSNVILKCDVGGNPTPEFYWKKDGDETVRSENKEWSLTNMALGDSGTYTCYAQNNVSGVGYDANKAININVVATTTTPTTSATSPTTTKFTGGKTDAVVTGGAGDNTTIIIIVVVVIGVIIIIAAIVAFVLFRRRRNKGGAGAPPEKPFNKNNLNMYNAKPDLVTDEKKQNYGYKNDEGLTYADLKFDDKPRSRRPVALADNMTDYADITIPQV